MARTHPDRLSLNELAQFGHALTTDRGKALPGTVKNVDGFRVGPVGGWECIATPAAWLIHGDRRTGRSTQLYLRWVAGLAAQNKRPQHYGLVYSFLRGPEAMRLTYACLEAAVPGEIDKTLFERHFNRFAFAEEDIKHHAHRGSLIDGWMVDGWTKLGAEVRATLMDERAPVIAYTL